MSRRSGLWGMAPAEQHVAVVGSGSWGTAFAKVLADGDNETLMWARRFEVADEINHAHRNSRYLQGINLPRSLHATASLEDAVAEAEMVFVAVPSKAARETLEDVRPHLRGDAVVVSLMKGVERSTLMSMSEVIAEVLTLPAAQIGVVSGPNLAREIALEQPTAAVASSDDLDTAERIAARVHGPYFSCFTNDDVTGTELGGVLKNLIAVAVGIVDGVGYGENTKASIITRGLAEMTEFAVAAGAKRETLSGLAGLGDLIATCSSPLSRNNQAGRLLGQGYKYADVVKTMEQVAEGLLSLHPVLQLARERDVRMPIAEQVAQVLDGSLAPRDLAPHLTIDEPAPGARARRGE